MPLTTSVFPGSASFESMPPPLDGAQRDTADVGGLLSSHDSHVAIVSHQVRHRPYRVFGVLTFNTPCFAAILALLVGNWPEKGS